MAKEDNITRPEMETPEYKAWRYAIFSRDSWKCVKCGSKGKVLQAHHIKRWVDAPNLRYLTSNGVTLCKECHDQVTGHEEQYEEEFTVIAMKGNAAKLGKSLIKKPPKEVTSQQKMMEAMRKWRPRNPRLRF